MIARSSFQIIEDIVAHHGSTTAFNTQLKLLFLLEPLDQHADLAVRGGMGGGTGRSTRRRGMAGCKLQYAWAGRGARCVRQGEGGRRRAWGACSEAAYGTRVLATAACVALGGSVQACISSREVLLGMVLGHTLPSSLLPNTHAHTRTQTHIQTPHVPYAGAQALLEGTGGRQEYDFSPLQQWLASPRAPQVCVISGPAGSGKSTVSAALCWDEKEQRRREAMAKGKDANAAKAEADAPGPSHEGDGGWGVGGGGGGGGGDGGGDGEGVLAGRPLAARGLKRQVTLTGQGGREIVKPLVHAYHFCRYSDVRR